MISFIISIFVLLVVGIVKFLRLPHAFKMTMLKLYEKVLGALEFLAGPGILIIVIIFLMLKKG